MGEIIVDGAGSGKAAKVDSDNRLYVAGTVQDEATHIAQNHASSFAWAISDNTSGAEYVLALKNTSSDKNLYIETMRMCSDAPCIWTVAFGKWSTVGGGALVTGQNINNSVITGADATAYMTATDLAISGNPLISSYAGAGSERLFRPDGKFVLGNGGVIYIHCSAASTAFLTALIHGFFKEPGNLIG